MTDRADIAIVGGGLAGAAAAIGLARRGRSAVLLERDRTTSDKVCGEFLSEEACRSLERLGLSVTALGAVPLDRLRLVAGNAEASCRLPFRAAGVPRRRLDPALRGLAAAAGAEVRTGARVLSVAPGEVRLADARLRAGAIVLATGKHDLRGAGRPRPARDGRAKIGFKCHLRMPAAAMRDLHGTIELHLYRGGYAGLLPISPDRCNLSFVVDERQFAAAGRRFDGVLGQIGRLSSALAERLDGSAPVSKPCAVASVPYGYRVWRQDDGPPGIWCVGDQAAVTPSFTGAGMAVALASGGLVADCLAGGASLAAYHDRLRRRIGPQVAAARLLDRLLARPPLQIPLTRTAARFPAALTLCTRLTRLGGRDPARAGGENCVEYAAAGDRTDRGDKRQIMPRAW